MTDLVRTIREALADICKPPHIFSGECDVCHRFRKRAPQLLSQAADEIEFMREVLQDHHATLPHDKDECDWCSRELEETP